MLDIYTGATAPPRFPSPPIEFVTIQLMPLADGNLSVSLKSTVFDETEFDLLDQEIVCERVATIDDVLALIKAHVRIAPLPQ
jgi:hypothetical protein